MKIFTQIIALACLLPCCVFNSKALRFNHAIQDGSLESQLIRQLAQDSTGLLWLATSAGLKSFDGKRVTNKPISFSGLDSRQIDIRSLEINKDDDLWIGTNAYGLIHYQLGKYTHYRQATHQALLSDNIKTIVEDHNEGVWVGTDQGLNHISTDKKIKKYLIDEQKVIGVNHLLFTSSSELLAATNSGIYRYDSVNDTFNIINLNTNNDAIVVNVLNEDFKGDIWAGTESGLFVLHLPDKFFSRSNLVSDQVRIRSLASDTQSLWMGTLYNGLFRLSYQNNSVQNYLYIQNDDSSISADTILSLFFDAYGVLWVGTFGQGLDYLKPNAVNFEVITAGNSFMECAESNTVYGLGVANKKEFWVAADKGLVWNDLSQQNCKYFGLEKFKNNQIKTNSITDVFPKGQNNYWITTNKGVFELNLLTESIEAVGAELPKKLSYFVYPINSEEVYVGTIEGLYLYNQNSKNSRQVQSLDPELFNAAFYGMATDSKEERYFWTSEGLVALSNDGNTLLLKSNNWLSSHRDISSLYIDKQDRFWMGGRHSGLFKARVKDGRFIELNQFEGISKFETVKAILPHGNDLWLSSENGLFRIKKNTQEVAWFNRSDGIQSNYFLRGVAYKSDEGHLYFSGRNGITAFDPSDIIDEPSSSRLWLRQLLVFNQTIKPRDQASDFILDQPISHLDQLELTHKDYVFGLEFGLSNIASIDKNKYAYKLQGFESNWNETRDQNNTVTYTNLAPGEYQFHFRKTRKFESWITQPQTLNIIVLPPWWKTWWAIMLYVFSSISCFAIWLHKNNAQNKAIAARLKEQVKLRTLEVEKQKKTVESLLMKKNEVFANVSHELKTPLTLILAPINQIIQTKQMGKNQKIIKMVQRNTIRLKMLVDQLLQLAKINDDITPIKKIVDSSDVVKAVVEVFQPAAQAKNISLVVYENPSVLVELTVDALEVILGNLISNAIKYTHKGGCIEISTKIEEKQLFIKVCDDGLGIDAINHDEIFHRFTRFNEVQSVEGSGVGLSIVNGLLKVNQGKITFESSLGKGSVFTVKLKQFQGSEEKSLISNKDVIKTLLPLSVTNHDDEDKSFIYQSKTKEHKTKKSILIIEDNQDMRFLLKEILSEKYQCILAENGKVGIKKALILIPDLIVCDVMMPGRNGFEVCQILRSDIKTSHVPLLILTALQDDISRVKGWEKNIDGYLTKPFDPRELLIRIENILSVREIIMRKNSQSVLNRNELPVPGLPKKEKEFVEKIKTYIKLNFADNQLSRKKIADHMAVSERQLQRKIKSLIDENPADLIRNFRLKKAAEFLLEGYQISVASDKCGFASVSHFSKCFKVYYGLTPSQYKSGKL